LWVRTAALDRLDPFVAEIGSATWDGHRGFTWVCGARRFATWEHSYISVLGLGAAVRQALDLGLDAIGQCAAALGARLRDHLGELPGVTTHDLGQTRCAGQGAQGPVLGLAGANLAGHWPRPGSALIRRWLSCGPGTKRRRPGGTGGWRHRLTSCVAQAAAAADLRREARARFSSTATVAATSAAAAAIKAICQPGMPPPTTTWTGTGPGAWCTTWCMCAASGAGSPSVRDSWCPATAAAP
jgi:hypothetical protein